MLSRRNLRNLKSMKLIYTHENKIIVDNAKNYLEQYGIASVLRNEFSGGAAGDLAPTQTWPELWVEDDLCQRAEACIQKLVNEQLGEMWVCPRCGEQNESTFELCWQCQSAGVEALGDDSPLL